MTSSGFISSAPPAVRVVVVAHALSGAAPLALALERAGVQVTCAPAADVVRVTLETAPDLVVALEGTLDPVRTALEAAVLTRGSIVATALDLIESNLDAQAEALLAVAASSPDHAALRLWPVHGTLAGYVERTFGAHERGLLSVRDAQRVGGVVPAGPGAAAASTALIAKLRPIAAAGERVDVTFLEGSVQLHDLRRTEPGERIRLEGRRVVILAQRSNAVDELDRVLTEDGARVAVIEPGGTGMGKARVLAPDVIVADEDLLDDVGGPSMTALRGDVRLAWAAIVATPTAVLSSQAAAVRDFAHVEHAIRDALAIDAAVTRAADEREPFELRYEAIGPLRLLRALARANGNVCATVRHAAATVEVEMEDALVVGVRARGRNGERADGHAALATLLTLPSGRVHVGLPTEERRIDVMASVDDAITVAMKERARIKATSRALELEAKRTRVPASSVIAELEHRVEVLRSAATGKYSTASTVAERAILPTDPPPVAPTPTSATGPSASATSVPSASPTPVPSASPSPVPSASPSPAPPPAGPATPVAPARPHPTDVRTPIAIAGTALIAAIGIAAVWSASGSTPPPSTAEPPAEGAELAAAFDAVEQEAEADVRAEETAESARAADAPPATLAPTDALEPVRPTALDGATIDNMILHGNFARSQGQYDLAVRYFDDVIASDATNGRALAGLTRTYQERGDLAEAARVARLLLDAHPDHPANFVLLADLLDARGDHDGAIAVLEDVTYRFPRYAPGQERLDAFRRAARMRARVSP